MILGFHYHTPAQIKNGKFYTTGYLGVFLEALARHVKELVCFMHTPLPSEEFLMDYAIEGPSIRLVSVGPHDSLPRRLLRARSVVLECRAEFDRLDALLVRGPTPLLPALSKYSRARLALLIVGDYERSAKDLTLPFFRKVAVQVWARVNSWQQKSVMRNCLVLVNNGLMLQEFQERGVRQLHLVRTTTLKSSDFYDRVDTCQREMVNLLYVGRIDLSKGLLEMVEALAGVRETGLNAHLHIVGWENQREGLITRKVRQKALDHGVEAHVSFHGKKKIGDELNYYYRIADIFLIGSKANEGFPRTIWEAFANSLPVIASAVGSIPFFLTSGVHACLVKPGSASDMKAAILQLATDGPLRRRLIENGRSMARESTLAVQTQRLVNIVQEYVSLK